MSGAGPSRAAIVGAQPDARAVDYDVLIAGAGLVGLALAVALARQGLTVGLVDGAGLDASPASPVRTDWDTRIYAISPGSAAFLGELGAWQSLPSDRVTAVESMRVEGDGGALLDFSAYELGERALAWIVEDRALRAALVAQIGSSGVVVHESCAFESLSYSSASAVLHLASGKSLSARILVGADGVRSWVRQASGIAAVVRPYGQTAVVANFACERAHRGRAYQWFHDGGIVAWLPLAGRRVSMVWSAPGALATELLAMPPEALAERAAARGRHALGTLQSLAPAAGFPLQLVKLPAVVAHRLALVGDAAHGVHPLAGQGVNLGFGDAATLARVLRECGPLADTGAPILLDRYARQRAGPVLAMQTVTDGLARLFGVTTPLVRSARNIGMAALNRLPPAKRLLAQSALR